LPLRALIGLPAVGSAGNVLLPELAFKLSLRLAPTTDPAIAAKAVKETLERDPPLPCPG